MGDYGEVDLILNAHVFDYYALLCRLAERDRRPMAQLHFFTLAQLERDPNWKPD